MYNLSETRLLCRWLFRSLSLLTSPAPPSPHMNHTTLLFYWKASIRRRFPDMYRPREWITWSEGMVSPKLRYSHLNSRVTCQMYLDQKKSFLYPSGDFLPSPALEKSSANLYTLVILLEISSKFPLSIQSFFRDFLPNKLCMFISYMILLQISHTIIRTLISIPGSAYSIWVQETQVATIYQRPVSSRQYICIALSPGSTTQCP